LRALVSGGSGFIGSHLVDALLASGGRVTVVDNFLTGRRQNLAHAIGNPRLTVIEADVVDPFLLTILDGPYDLVFHLASPASPVGYRRHPLETLRANSVGTDHLLAVARRDGARFLLASTSEVYGDPLVHPQPESYWGNVNPVGPRSCYDEGKRFAESLAVHYGEVHGVDVRIARIFNTYGPRSAPQDGRLIPNLCVQALADLPLTIHGDGTQTRSFCYVDDLTRGLMLLMETEGLAGEVVNLGNPVELQVLAIAAAILAAAGSGSPIEYVPRPPEDPARRRPDIRKAQRLLGWQPSVGLDIGLANTLAFFRSELNTLGEDAKAAVSSCSGTDRLVGAGPA
jgi:nucleoside-diphosphate-sugar epimerase